MGTARGEYSFLLRSNGLNLTNMLSQSIRLKLSDVTDWLQLAQGLLSNISRLCIESEKVLSDIFRTQPTSGVYGRFVPAFLKSSSHNLSFGD
jgi:hypothetical protein